MVTDQRQRLPPPEFRGGLLIDAPGLGKTLSVIALLAYQKERIASVPGEDKGKTTLLIVPKTRP